MGGGCSGGGRGYIGDVCGGVVSQLVGEVALGAFRECLAAWMSGATWAEDRQVLLSTRCALCCTLATLPSTVLL